MTKYGFLGPKGTFTESALNGYLKNIGVENCTAAASIQELFKNFSNGEYNNIIFPLENTIEGPVTIVYDLLHQSSQKASMIAEITMPINQCFMSSNKTNSEEINVIISYRHAIAQCSKFINENYPNAQIVYSSSTASSVDMLKTLDANKQYGIIGNKRLIDLHDIKLLQENIQDTDSNITRFGVLSNNDESIKKNADKTSIICSTQQDKPGSLYSILESFKERKINLTQIMSRPTKEKFGEYLFFIDFEGNANDTHISEALNEIKENSLYYKLVGSYERIKLC